MKINEAGRKIESIFTLLLFAVFAGAVLLVLLLGVRSYRAQVQNADQAYARRTCVQYVAAKVRAGDAAGAVSVGDFSETEPVSTLFISRNIDGELYCTRIYYYNGYVHELFAPAGGEYSPEDGGAVLPAAGLEFSMENDMLRVDAADIYGGSASLDLWLRSGGEAAP